MFKRPYYIAVAIVTLLTLVGVFGVGLRR